MDRPNFRIPGPSTTHRVLHGCFVSLLLLLILLHISLHDLALFCNHLTATNLASSTACFALFLLVLRRTFTPETRRWWYLRRRSQAVGIAVASTAACVHYAAVKCSAADPTTAHRLAVAGCLGFVLAVAVAYGTLKPPSTLVAARLGSAGFVVGCTGSSLMLWPAAWDTGTVVHMAGFSMTAAALLMVLLVRLRESWATRHNWELRNGNAVRMRD